MTSARRSVRGALEEVADLLGLAVSEGATLAGLRVDALKKRTQKQLLEVARKLDLSGVSKLPKDELASRVLEALKASVRAEVFAHNTKDKAAGQAEGEMPGKKNGVTAHGSGALRGASVAKKVNTSSTAETERAVKARDGAAAGHTRSSSVAKVASDTNPDEASGATAEGSAANGEPDGLAQRSSSSAVPATASTIPTLAEEEPTGRAKFDLGSAAKWAQRPVENIPWGYGLDRITAAAVDPEQLFVYWEVTDDAIARARHSLGNGGPEAWLNLRVYDTTGRLFDGTNANSYIDHALGRDDRQWFLHIGKPQSTAFIDIGMRSAEGFFARIARSGRVEFPRREPERDAEVEWLTVRVATGHVEPAGKGAPALPGSDAGGSSGAEDASLSALSAAPRLSFEPLPLWLMRQAPQGGGQVDQRLTTWLDERGGGWQRLEWSEIVGEGWFGVEGRVEWQGPLTVTSWEAGPFSYPVEVSEPIREEWHGGSFGFRKDGVTHMVYGPWQVVIRNLGAHYGRTVLSEWQVYRSWVVEGGQEVRALGAPLETEGMPVLLGGSEVLYAGASERRWQMGSELRLMGASERFRMGASELRLGGASERLMVGASEWTMRGASERRFLGASAFAWGGASESRFGAGSEKMFRGASERLGGSEGRLGGSEGRLGGSEGRLEPSGESIVDGASGRYPKLEG